MSSDNKRSYFRLMLPVPLSGTLKIIGLNNKKIDSKLAVVLIHDLGAGGMRIHAKHNFPIHPDLLLEFRFRLFHTEHKHLGTIVRKSSHTDTIYEYGIVFSHDENERQSLLHHLNMLDLKLRSANRLSSCSFCTDEELESFYSPSSPTASSGNASA
ncbi:PilZ domain-containing protein [Paenibacillus flagellatus]|uniref:PilZ domain-containing protein n=1 Tax=Paenibacillus flagellatus TaxID=2211139 RepID=A0A2V5KUV6_9BACL|nr:PilZ domain-containing protein [Paenibacillus flagellatus]PYI55787.1 PilZ domain-containing protein [Paenibacillus flagellatus]